MLRQISKELELLESFDGELKPNEKPLYFRLKIQKAVSTWKFVIGMVTDGPYDDNVEKTLYKQFDKLYDTLESLLLDIRKVVHDKDIKQMSLWELSGGNLGVLGDYLVERMYSATGHSIQKSDIILVSENSFGVTVMFNEGSNSPVAKMYLFADVTDPKSDWEQYNTLKTPKIKGNSE
jgi:hypothetical protein